MSLLKRVRNGVEDENYSYRFTFEGKPIWRTTPFADRVKAEKAEAAHRKLLETGQHEAASNIRRRKEQCENTIGEIITAYLNSDVDANAKTRRCNVNTLCNILKQITGTIVVVDFDKRTCASAAPASLISATLAKDFFKHASKELEDETQSQQGSTRRTANAVGRKLVSLFTPRALAAYADAGLKLPEVPELLATVKARKFTKAVKTDYNPPAEPIIVATLKAWRETDDRELFLVVGHALAFGERIAEIAQTRWNWHTTREGIPCIDSRGDFKNRSGFISVRALDPFYTILMDRVRAMGWQGEAEDFIIPGSDAFRNDGVFRNVTAWMRGLGWKTHKTVHELRAYSGSQVAMRYDIYDAQRWLRHTSVKVTEAAYMRYIQLFRPADPAKMQTKWAEVRTAEFIPQVLVKTG